MDLLNSFSSTLSGSAMASAAVGAKIASSQTLKTNIAAARPSSQNVTFNKSVVSTKQPSTMTSAWNKNATRSLSLHEYQSKNVLEQFGIKVMAGSEASDVEEAYQIAKRLKAAGANKLVVKCQVLAGGRGKGRLSSGLQGGVKLADSPEEIAELARQMLGYRLVTHQTTSDGELVKKVMIVNAADVSKELYLALLMDRSMGGPCAVVSQMGGMDIEDVAEKSPHAIKTVPIDIKKGMTCQDAKTIAGYLGLSSDGANGDLLKTTEEQVKRLYELFIELDATQVEINPLAIVKNGKQANDVCFLDAKLSFDDNAVYRQKELFAMEDKDTLDQREVTAEKAGLNFVGLDGNVGCLVNGAGLAMATMDIIKLHGGNPANFLDVGGGADEDQVKEAFRILKSDTNVKVIFVNIFGGIMKCDTIAQGLISAAKSVDLCLPMIIRLIGNRVELGKQLIESAKLKNMTVVDDFESAAKEVVKAVRASS